MRRFILPVALLLLGLGLLLVYFIQRGPLTKSNQLEKVPEPNSLTTRSQSDPFEDRAGSLKTAEIIPQRTPLPAFPTPTIGYDQLPTPRPMTKATITPLEIKAIPGSCTLPDCLSRTGVSGQLDMVDAAYHAGLHFGNYFNWWTEPEPPALEGVEFWQTIGISDAGFDLPLDIIELALKNQPGSTWIIGNEPDITWQDNVGPERYAEIYQQAYAFIKEADPTARVAPAPVGQPTPLRLAYLDRVLGAYEKQTGQPLPADIWTIHAFILREESGGWGVGIPPGMTEDRGRLYEIQDHDDLEILRQHIIEFRAWMAARGYQDRPLAVTEFGILHPSDYGFPPEVVIDFMLGALEIFSTIANDTGYKADDNRLVQWWFWYSVYDGGDFPTGNLYDPQSDQLTEIGQAFADYVTDH